MATAIDKHLQALVIEDHAEYAAHFFALPDDVTPSLREAIQKFPYVVRYLIMSAVAGLMPCSHRAALGRFRSPLTILHHESVIP